MVQNISIAQPEPPHGMGRLYTASKGDLEETKSSSDAKEILTNTRVAADGTLEDQLLAAAQNGENEVVRDLLKKDGIKIYATNTDGKTALHLASQNGYKEVVQELLKTSEETGNIKDFLNAKDDRGRTALHLASQSGCQEVVQELLETSHRTGIINEVLSLKDYYESTALHLASQNGYKEVAQELLKTSEETGNIKDFLMAKDGGNRTALHLASEEGYKEVVQELLKTSEKTGIINEFLDAKTLWSKTALHLASTRGHKEAVHELLNTSCETEIINRLLISKDLDEKTALHLASDRGIKEVVQELLITNKRLNSNLLNLKDEDGRTALHIACAKGSEEIVRMLIENDADIEIQSTSRDTPLMEAIWNWEESIVKLLLKKGANPKTRSENYSALTAACYRPKTHNIARSLLDYGSDINDKDPDGWAPIHTACWKKAEANLAVVNLLIDRNADLEAQNSSDKTPLHLALKLGNQEITRAILAKSKNIEIEDEEGLTPLHVAAQQQNEEAIELLIKKSAKLEAKDKKGCTALHHAIRNEKNIDDLSSYKATVTLLLNNYAPIDAVNADGETPLHWATKYGGLDIVQLILRRNPNVDASDRSKETALHKVHACLVEEDRGKITEELLKKAKIGAKNDKGQTALHTASEAGCTDVVEVLLKHCPDKEFINTQDSSTFTPLHLASKHGRGDTIELLLSKGADVETRLATTSKEPNRTALALAIGSLLTEEDEISSKKAISSIAKKSNEATRRNALYRAQMSLDTEDQLNIVLKAMKASDDPDDAYPKASDVEQTELIWCAVEPKRHDILLKKLKERAHLLDKEEASLKPVKDSVLQWAAFYGYYIVVYWLLRKSELRPKDGEANNRGEAIYIAEKMLNRVEDQGTKTAVRHHEADGAKDKNKMVERVPGSNERTEDRLASSSPNKETQRFQHTLDMLKDPPIGTDNGAASGDCKIPSLKDKSEVEDPSRKDISRNYRATIVDFYSRGSRVDLFKRQRPIYDVIYKVENGGPDGVMKMGISILKEVIPDDSLETQSDREEGSLGLRWIHLPANNLDWMEHVVQRLCHDSKQSERQHVALRDFLRGSWREMPLGDSSTKFMNPGFVKGSRKSDRLNAGGRAAGGERQLDHKTGEAEKQNNYEEDEREHKMVQDDQEENATSKEHRGPEKMQQSRVLKHSSLPSLENDGLDRQQTPAAIYMPYLTFEKCYRQGISHSSGSFPAKYNNMMDVYNKRSTRRQVVHKIRSLDESYYPNLPNLTNRNANQVATRYLTDRIQGNKEEVGDWWPILAVGQLWLWIIDDKTIISSSTAGYCGAEDPVVDGIFNQLREQMEQGGSSSLPSTVYQLSRLILKYCVNFTKTVTWKDITRELKVGEKYAEKLQEQEESLLRLYGEKPPLEIFAESINRVANDENDLFENFVNQVERNKNESRREASNDYDNKNKEKTKSATKTKQEQSSQDKAPMQQNRYSHGYKTAEDNSEARYANKTDDTKQTNEHEDWEAIYEAANLLREVKDIQDELHMLKAVVADQESVWNSLTGQKDNSRRRVENHSIMERGPADILEDLEEMNRLVDSIETSVKDTLNLEQNGINITEATISRQLTEQSMRQGRSIMAFTVVTIFFLPMSFLTSMFALNVTSFQHDASGNLLYQPTFIFPIIFCVSIGLGAMIIIPALFYPTIEEFLKDHWNSLHKKPRTDPPPTESQKTVDSKDPNQDSTNKTTPQTADPLDAPSKGTEASLESLGSFLRNLRSSLRSRRRSEIIDTEKGPLERPR